MEVSRRTIEHEASVIEHLFYSFQFAFYFLQEFEEIWPKLDLIVDGGTLSNSEQSRSGSTVVDLSEEGTFFIVRNGCARDHVVNILEKKYNLKMRGEDS